MNLITFLLAYSKLSFPNAFIGIVVFIFSVFVGSVILLPWEDRRKKLLYIPAGPDENIRTRSAFITKKIWAAQDEDALWAVLRLIHAYEKDYPEDANARREVSDMKDAFDMRAQEIFNSIVIF
jgi:hypothetical protein